MQVGLLCSRDYLQLFSFKPGELILDFPPGMGRFKSSLVNNLLLKSFFFSS